MPEALFDPAVLAMLIPVLVLIGWIVMAILKHRERMALIERGMDPDAEKRAERAQRR